MKCLALGMLKNDSQPEWHIPGSGFLGFFNINEEIRVHQKELLTTCHSLQLNSCEFATCFDYYLAAFKTYQGCCMVICDTLLTHKQMFNLASWILKSDLTLEHIAQDLLKCTQQEPQIYALQKELDAVKEILYKDMELLNARQEELDIVLEKANHLNEHSITFRDKTKKMNSCLPDCKLF